MTESTKSESADLAPAKPAKQSRSTDVDALLSEVTGAARAKGAAKPSAPKPAADPGAAAAPETATAATAATVGTAAMVATVATDPAAAPADAAAAAKKTVRVRQLRSGICTPSDQKAALKALGLRRIRHEVELPDNPSTRGQILKVRHLVVVVE